MNEKQISKPRPYWRVDLKWIAGIELFLALSAALLLFNLSAITERQQAVNISSNVVASVFSRDGAEDEKSLDDLKQNVALLPGDSVAPISQFPWITISKADLMSMSAHDLRLKIFEQLTGPIYDKGVEGAAQSFTTDIAQQEQFTQQASVLGVLTKQTHETLQMAFIIAAIVAVIALAQLVIFSAGWGRLVSPAVVFLIASPVGVIVGLLLSNGVSLVSLPSSVVSEIGSSLTGSYLAVAAAGASLSLVALVGKVVQTIVRRSK